MVTVNERDLDRLCEVRGSLLNARPGQKIMFDNLHEGSLAKVLFWCLSGQDEAGLQKQIVPSGSKEKVDLLSVIIDVFWENVEGIAIGMLKNVVLDVVTRCRQDVASNGDGCAEAIKSLSEITDGKGFYECLKKRFEALKSKMSSESKGVIADSAERDEAKRAYESIDLSRLKKVKAKKKPESSKPSSAKHDYAQMRKTMTVKFFDAINSQNLKSVQDLITTGFVDLNVRDKIGGQTPLHFAILQYFMQPDIAKKIVDRIIDAKASLDIQDNNGFTPLHLAVTTGNPDLVKKLIAKGARLDILNNMGQTPLTLAVSKGYTAIASELMKYNTTINIADTMGKTPLHHAILLSDRMPGCQGIADQLIEAGADVNATDKSGDTPLHCAIKVGNKELVRKLLATKKVDIEKANDEGLTPLAYARKYQVGKGIIGLIKKMLITVAPGKYDIVSEIKREVRALCGDKLKNITYSIVPTLPVLTGMHREKVFDVEYIFNGDLKSRKTSIYICFANGPWGVSPKHAVTYAKKVSTIIDRVIKYKREWAMTVMRLK